MDWKRIAKASNGIDLVYINNDDTIVFEKSDVYVFLQGFVSNEEGYGVYLCDISCDNAVKNYSQVKNMAIRQLLTQEYNDESNYNKVIFLDSFNISRLERIKYLVTGKTEADISEISVLNDNSSLMDVISKFNTNIEFMLVDPDKLLKLGGYNEELSGAEDYDVLCRGVEYSLVMNGDVCKALISEDSIRDDILEDYQTYAYEISRYVEKLKKSDMFDYLVKNRMDRAQEYGIQDYFIDNLEAMLLRNEVYFSIAKKSNPILILMGEGLCYGVLDIFAKRFMEALLNINQAAVCLDVNRLVDGARNDNKRYSYTKALGFCDAHYQGVVGFQTELFDLGREDGNLLGNDFKCPVFQIIFDHPLYISYFLMLPINKYYVLAQDGGYAEYVRKHMKNVYASYRFSPAGESCQRNAEISLADKEYGITFIGSYNDYRQYERQLDSLSLEEKTLAMKMLDLLKHYPDYSMEEAFDRVLEKENIKIVDSHEYVVKLHRMMNVGRAIMNYYRENVVKTILDAGIELHVYSDSWKNSPFNDRDNLIIHSAVSYEDSLEVMKKSRISLNIMSWHKDGMTERIANSMLNYSLCLTDKTKYLTNIFKDGEDIVFFDLNNIENVSEIIKYYLDSSNDENVRKIIGNAFVKANDSHTWDARAKQFMEIIEH